MKKKSIGAFTLVEVLIGIFLSSIVMGGGIAVWLRVSRQIATSHARQSLQKQLRTVSNYVSGDFASIQEGSFNITSQSSDGKKISFKFNKFEKAKDDNIAQNAAHEIQYTLENGLFVRKSASKLKILSTNLEAIILTKGDENTAPSGSSDLMKLARESVLNIELTAKRPISGSAKFMFHTERTMVVMRDEYSKKTNPTYMSNFDLAKLNQSDVLQLDDEDDANFGPGSSLDLDRLKKLDDPQLTALEAVQNDMMDQAEASLKQLNDGVGDTDTGSGAWYKPWTWSPFEFTDGEKVKALRNELKGADEKEALETVKGKLEEYVKDAHEKNLVKAFKDTVPDFANLLTKTDEASVKRVEMYKKVYEMALNDRRIDGAYDAIEGDKPPKPESMLDKSTKIVESWKGSDGNREYAKSEHIQQQREKANEIKDAYAKVKLDWMGEFGKEDDDVKAYDASKALLDMARSKLTIVELRDTAKDNIDKINQAKKENNK